MDQKRQDAIDAGLAAIQAGQTQVVSDQLGVAYDIGASNQKDSDGSFTQADIDAAVTQATDPLNQQITDLTSQVQTLTVQDQEDVAKAASLQATLDDLQGNIIPALQQQIADLTSKLAADDAIVVGLKSNLASLQQIESALAAFISPPPPVTV